MSEPLPSDADVTLPPRKPSAEATTLPPAVPATSEAATLPPAAPPTGPAVAPPETGTLLTMGSRSTPAPAAAADRAAVPGYEVLGELGRGGMGVVYKARQTKLGRLVALKMILAGGHAGAAELARFKTEAEAVARLQHANIVQVHEVGEQGGLPFFSLEFCPGGSLDRKLDGTPWQPRAAAKLVKTLARAMHHAHGKGVVHRDLKPANVLLAEDETPKITDFFAVTVRQIQALNARRGRDAEDHRLRPGQEA